MQSAVLEQLIQQQRKSEKRRILVIGAFGLLILTTFILDIMTGPSLLDATKVLHSLFEFIGLPYQVAPSTQIIVTELRLPIAIMAIVVGGALGMGGAEMQTLLNNTMASPYTLGMAAAAGFGAAITLYMGSFGLSSYYAVPMGAFLCCMLSACFLFSLASARHISSGQLILAGIALLFLFQSLLSLVQFVSSPELSQQILFWLFGSLTKATWNTVAITSAVVFVGGILLLKDAWKLTALRLGEERAKSVGVNITRLRMKTLFIVAVITATVTSFVGIIGFVGIVAPNMAKSMVGEDQRFFLPLSFLIGAFLLSGASVLSKIIVPGALFPIGIVTAIIGVPFFFWLILAKRG
ncbi:MULTISPECIES: FecCD family ABC transporter permease [Vibrio]|uniref:Iron ABC transporter permease n=2 Tax=Vibrio natriegens TaxID=691 RepID=A0AAN1CVP3_VIBNA|nr:MULTISPECIES: iron ABC transporter permease [Vibrio]MEE3878079.1 iron ABC transporter permease [Vibrio sp. YYF0003]CAH0529093.1 Vitamin B12 import system permease protein BtuC [Catenococcus thiocycli]ALR15687.1 iron ABC transporter permease [Vibrio natriegens NBRC 15636 = ATCC 14048 = DSM 759]ANQ12456.1 iron ABC transporter permease [Vibrio natriegens NBRC 15636 = ATCC 14048 = DSM 759]ANQ16885.1 iron ABC transporter permease [Vibrio natriegens]